MNFVNYLKYSGLTIMFGCNPLHWKVLPWIQKELDPWESATYSFGFLFLTIRFWIDDGSW